MLDIKSGFLNAVTGGWQIGETWTAQSEAPQVISLGGTDRSGAGNGYDRPNATGVSYVQSNPVTSLWYNPEAFVEQPAGTFGSVGRNTAVGPGILALDFAAHKEFQMPYNEQHGLQFRFEAFNVMNHPVWANPNGNVLSTGFEVITGTAIPMRQAQLALEYCFQGSAPAPRCEGEDVSQ